MCVPDSLLVEVGVAVSTGELEAIVEVVGLVTELATIGVDITTEVPTKLDVVEVTNTCNELQMKLSPTLTTRSKPTTKSNKKINNPFCIGQYI